MPPVEVASDINAWCKKCELVLAHVVVAIRGTRAAKVECKTCKEVHAYRKSVPKASKGKTKTPKVNSLETLLGDRDISEGLAYAMSGVFAPDTVIDHKKFGVGVVTRLVDRGVMEVVFEGGPKLLVYGR